jgi:hypothetical protein
MAKAKKTHERLARTISSTNLRTRCKTSSEGGIYNNFDYRALAVIMRNRKTLADKPNQR